MPTAPANAAPRRNPWILGPARDLTFVILTPLLVLPLVLGLRGLIPDRNLYEAVMAFGALGHHLPGMMRAYGDRELFQRFRTRFLLAPLLLGGLCAWFAVEGLHAMAAVAFGWGLWHGWMQVHGFARIYDAKVGSLERRTAYLDLAFVSTWFLALVIVSPYRLGQLADVLSRCGVPSPTPGFVSTLRTLAVFAVAGVTALWAAHGIARWRAGCPPSPLKLAFLLTTIAAFAYATCFVPNLILGVALFEILHDVQYLAIVWAYNRARVTKGVRSGSLTRLMFGGSALGVAIYLALIASYGALGPFAQGLHARELRDAALGLLLASQLLHFYYDGFIWKVREGETRRALGIADDEPRNAHRSWWGGLSAHGAKWVVGLVPILWLASVEARDGSANVASLRAAAALGAGDADALRKFSLELAQRGEHERSIDALRRAVEQRPGDQEVADDLAVVLSEAAQAWLLRGGDEERARVWVREALELQPRLPQELLALARHLVAPDPQRAVATFRLAFLAAPQDEAVRLAWVRVLAEFRQYRQALDVLGPWLAEHPAHAEGRELERRIRAELERAPR